MRTPLAEICGDERLSATDRRRYLAAGIGEIFDGLRHRDHMAPFIVDATRPAVRRAISEGASPFRMYVRSLVEHILSTHLIPPGVACCDIGCGAGGHSRLFSGHFAGYVGIDIVANPLWHELMYKRNQGLAFVQSSATELALATESVNLCFSSSALEHIADVKSAVSEIARVLQPGGHGLHVVPGPWSLLLYTFHGYRRFSPRQLTNLFQEAGLEVLQIWSLGGAASFLLHLVWISWLETGAIYDWLAISRSPSVMRKILRPLRNRARQGRGLAAYSVLLRFAAKLDGAVTRPAIGHGILVRKPES